MLDEGGWGEFQGLPMILGLSEDMSAPRVSIADDKVTRLRVNLCYLHLITVSCVLVPPDGPPFHPYSAHPAVMKASGLITLSLLSFLKPFLTPALPA